MSLTKTDAEVLEFWRKMVQHDLCGEAIESNANMAVIKVLFREIDRLRSPLVVEVWCGNCGKTYTYNRADGPDRVGERHGVGYCGE